MAYEERLPVDVKTDDSIETFLPSKSSAEIKTELEKLDKESAAEAKELAAKEKRHDQVISELTSEEVDNIDKDFRKGFLKSKCDSFEQYVLSDPDIFAVWYFPHIAKLLKIWIV